MSLGFSLAGKVAIVTGASRGIGESIARAMADAGAQVVCASRKHAAVKSVSDSIGERAFAIAAHTGKPEDCERLVAEATAHFGKVDILVNNAATNPYFGPLIDTDDTAWEKTFEVNAKGYFMMARAFAKHFRGRSGTDGAIVSIASVAGLEAAPLMGCYAMTKAAVLSMTKTLAVELAPSGIRVNAIAPGFVDTRFAAAVVQDETLVREVERKTPLGRVARPEEIAGGAVFLASSAASYVTGHTLVMDGGMTIC